MRLTLGCLILIGSMNSVLAQHVKPSGALSENTYEAAKSSGSAIVGAQLVATHSLDPNKDGSLRFAFFTPGSWDQGVCISVESANGLYDGKGHYSIDVGTGDVDQYTLYPTQFSDRVAALEIDELAVAVKRGLCTRRHRKEGHDEQTPVQLALAFWRTLRRLDENEKVRIYLNPFDALKAELIVNDQHKIACENLALPVAIEYSMHCDIPGSMLKQSPAKLQILSRAPGRGVVSSWVELHFGR